MKKQHVDINRKLAIRRQLLKLLPIPKGRAAYVPFIGDADIAATLYQDFNVWGADLDADRLAIADSRLVNAVLRRHNCDLWPFEHDNPPPFHVGDFDAYGYPYDSFRAFWRNAPKADRVALFFTDGQQAILRGGRFRLPTGEKAEATRKEKGRYANLWWSRHIFPWFRDEMEREGWTIVRTRHYTRLASMLYWGAVVRRSASDGAEPEPVDGFE